MNLTSLTVADLKAIQKLLERKESILAQIEQIQAQLAAYETGGAAPAPSPRRGRKTRRAAPKAARKAAPAPVRRAKRGALKARILELIQAAGEAGVTVKDLAAQLGLSYNRVYTWFYKTGKSLAEIKKIGEAEYVWAGAAPAPADLPAAETKPAGRAKGRPAAKKGKRRATKRGALKASVIGLLQEAGKQGLSVKEIAAHLQVSPKNIYVWFTSTGKKIQEIERVGPAKYAWVG